MIFLPAFIVLFFYFKKLLVSEYMLIHTFVKLASPKNHPLCFREAESRVKKLYEGRGVEKLINLVIFGVIYRVLEPITSSYFYSFWGHFYAFICF